ncbi:hypothetical protein LTR78_007232 [Recurvomyces mirabilis]|uniref:FCP1 homology domain-containing protein n=1 Tax=Recurvomyces mirabilis TaxID=574656 RepID=A0AAE0WJJ5_9PEZI|nr:hypothetical protein LTR78_007232 [Recurvomyces mirabilis]KAK5155525.1 hypothetical protein LTS14_005786 [Recurvomyces mirabilis]
MSTGDGLDGTVTEHTDEMGSVKGNEGRFSGGKKKRDSGRSTRNDVSEKTKEAEVTVGRNRADGERGQTLDDALPVACPIRPVAPTTKSSPRAPSHRQHTRTIPNTCAPTQHSKQPANSTMSSSAPDTLGCMTIPDQQPNGGKKLSPAPAHSHAPNGTKSSSLQEIITNNPISLNVSATVQASTTVETARHQVEAPQADTQDLPGSALSGTMGPAPRTPTVTSSDAHVYTPRDGGASLAHALVGEMTSLSLQGTSKQLPPARVTLNPTYVHPHRRQKRQDEVVFQPRGTTSQRTAPKLQPKALPFHPSIQAECASGLPTTSSSAKTEKLPKEPSKTRPNTTGNGIRQSAQNALQPPQPREKSNVPSRRTTDHSRSKKKSGQATRPAASLVPYTSHEAPHVPAQNFGIFLPIGLPATSDNLSIDRDRELTNGAARYGDFNHVLFNKTYLPKARPSLPPRPIPTVPDSRHPSPTEAYLKQADLPVQPHIGSPRRLLVVLDLNGTVCYRKKSKGGIWSFTPRPGVTEFLDYLLQNHKVLVWSSARPENVAGVCSQLFDEEQLLQLVSVWGRDTLHLSAQEYNEKVQVYKQLSWVWDDSVVAASSIGNDRWAQHNTVLIDDSERKAVSEPHNLIQIEEFEGMTKGTKLDVLEQIVEYLEVLRMTREVSAVIKKRPYVYRTNRVE